MKEALIRLFSAYCAIGICFAAAVFFGSSIDAVAEEQGVPSSEDEFKIPPDSHMPNPAPDEAALLQKNALEKLQAGDTVAAEKLFKDVLKIDRKNADAYYNLGAIAEKKGDLPTALHYYKSGLKANGSDIQLSAAVDKLNAKLGKTKSGGNASGKSTHHISPVARRVIYTGLRVGARMALRRW